jgi:hypothetical protein
MGFKSGAIISGWHGRPEPEPHVACLEGLNELKFETRRLDRSDA